MYPRRMVLRRVELEGGGRAEGAGDIRGEGSVFEVKDRRSSRVDGEAEMSGAIVGECGGGSGGRGGGTWSRHAFSPACLEPTRTGVGSPGEKWRARWE